MLFGLTPLGVVHTAISLGAVFAGLIALLRDGKITLKNRLGQVYAVTTVLTCLTAFGIYEHGGFGVAHAVGIVTLAVLGAGALAEFKQPFGRISLYLATIAYSATFLFHLIPAVTETSTRVPLGHPLLPNDKAPQLQVTIQILLALFIAGAIIQVLALRKARSRAMSA